MYLLISNLETSLTDVIVKSIKVPKYSERIKEWLKAFMTEFLLIVVERIVNYHNLLMLSTNWGWLDKDWSYAKL